MANKYKFMFILKPDNVICTVNENKILVPLEGMVIDSIDWEQGFDYEILANLNKDFYSTLPSEAWLVTNANLESNNTVSMESRSGNIWMGYKPQMVINTKGYSSIKSITPSFSSDDNDQYRYAISFNGLSNKFYTKGKGYIPDENPLIPSTSADRDTAGITVSSSNSSLDLDIVFDNSNDTSFAVDSVDTYVTASFASPKMVKGYTVNLGTDCRMPCIVTIEGLEEGSTTWVEIEKITIRAIKDVSRKVNIFKDITYDGIRWKFTFDPDALKDDPDKQLVIKQLNLNGGILGDTMILLNNETFADYPESLHDQGMTADELSNLDSVYYDKIFADTGMHVYSFVASNEDDFMFKQKMTDLTVEFPDNGPPSIVDLIASRDTIHEQDVILEFTVEDPEHMDCTFVVKVNGKEVSTGSVSYPNIRTRVVVPNEDFSIINGLNEVEIIATDNVGLTANTIIQVRKTNELPSLMGILEEYDYTFTINDDDKTDLVKWEAYLINDKHPEDNPYKVDSGDFAAVPGGPYTFHIPEKEIVTSPDGVSHNNTLRIIITDNFGGQVIIDETFAGKFVGLLFQDEDEDYLSTDLGAFLKKVVFTPITGGETTPIKKIKVINSTKYTLTNVVVYSVGGVNQYIKTIYTHKKDASGNYLFYDSAGDYTTDITLMDTSFVDDPENPGYVMTKKYLMMDATVLAQLSLDENFDNPKTYYSLPLPSMASRSYVYMYARVVSTDVKTESGAFDFQTVANAKYIPS